MLTDAQARFLGVQRVARFASADRAGAPHVVPVCYALLGESAYFTIDEKPKRGSGRALKRLRNIDENPRVALVVDRYDDDWSRLGWVLLRGRAAVVHAGAEHAMAQAALRERYPQLLSMSIESKPVVAIRIESVSSWGNLEVP